MYCYLITYDVECSRTRRRLAALLESLGTRVQYSVFEVFVYKHHDMDRIVKRAFGIISSQDNIRVYYIHQQARARCSCSNGDALAEPAAFFVL